MKLLQALLFVYVADVYTQLISDQETSPGFIQTQCRNKTHHSIPSSRTSEERGSVATGFTNNRQAERKEHREANVKGNRRTDHSPKVFTNISQDLHGNNIRYIQRLKSSSESDKIIFYDDVNYDRKPFTNERKPEDNFKYNTGPSLAPSGTPYRVTGKEHQDTPANNKVSFNGPIEGTYNNKNEETTTEEFELDNRVAFSGDGCATGLVKVKGKCVKEM